MNDGSEICHESHLPFRGIRQVLADVYDSSNVSHGPRVRRRPTLNRRSFTSTTRPERKELDAFRIVEHTIIKKMPYALDVYSPHVRQLDVSRPTRCERCDSNDAQNSLEFFTNRIGRGQPVSSPQGLELANVLGCKRADLNRQWILHSRLIISAMRSSAEIVSPRSHWAIDSSRIAFSSGDTSKVSSGSRARRVTSAPSGSSPS